MGTETQERYRDWVGRRVCIDDEMAPATARAAAALFDRDDLEMATGDPLPDLWHWFYFLPTAPQRRLSEDGHPERGDFIPPIPLPRRMFAGARARFLRPLVLGRPASRESEILDVTFKTGRTGELAFVTVAHRILQDGALCVDEERDIVYREAGGTVSAPVPVPPRPAGPGSWEREVRPDSRLLFRFSALTFNAHRIHYDRPYAMDEEGYPGLVVHGPLTAMLLADLVRRHDPSQLAAFSFRGRAPLFDLGRVRLLGRREEGRVVLEARGPDDRPALTAVAEWP
ncbi:MAG: acyl-CoA dehydrogenase [Gemmatimonadota bacterium]|jgi:3-methylfumaryl-CoA hydratase